MPSGDVGNHTTNGSSAPAVAVAVSTAAPTAAATALSSAAATTTLFGPVAALAVDRTITSWLKRHRRGLSTTGTDNGCPGAHTTAAAVTATVVVSRMGGSVTTAAGILFRLATRFAAPGRGIAPLLEKLLFARSKDKLLTAVATGK